MCYLARLLVALLLAAPAVLARGGNILHGADVHDLRRTDRAIHLPIRRNRARLWKRGGQTAAVIGVGDDMDV